MFGCALVLQPFLSAILWAAVICFSTWPVYGRCERAVGGNKSLAAALMTLLVALLPGYMDVAIADLDEGQDAKDMVYRGAEGVLVVFGAK
jgi:hypothetical protein